MIPSEAINLITQYRNKYDFYVEQRAITEKEKTKLTIELEEKKNIKTSLDNIDLMCKLLLEKLTYENKANLESFITMALQSIFSDKNYSINLNIKEDTKRPSLQIMLVENDIQQEITDAVGGGIITVLGLLFQIYYIEVFELSKIMFIDEGLKEVSKSNLSTSVSYLDNLLEFLNYISKTRGYTFIIITHDDRVIDFAKTVYTVKDGEVKKLYE